MNTKLLRRCLDLLPDTSAPRVDVSWWERILGSVVPSGHKPERRETLAFLRWLVEEDPHLTPWLDERVPWTEDHPRAERLGTVRRVGPLSCDERPLTFLERALRESPDARVHRKAVRRLRKEMGDHLDSEGENALRLLLQAYPLTRRARTEIKAWLAAIRARQNQAQVVGRILGLAGLALLAAVATTLVVILLMAPTGTTAPADPPARVSPAVRLETPTRAFEEKPPDPSPTTGARTHTVQPGDVLWKIARDRLGDSDSWQKIHELNQDLIRDPDLLLPGWVLRLPEVDSRADPNR